MEVVELDRPWLETPFLFQGFTIQSEDELAQLRESCDHVFIDDEKLGGWSPPELRVTTSVSEEEPEQPAEPPPQLRTYEILVPLEDELETARQIYALAKERIDAIHADVRAGRMFNAEAAKATAKEMVGSILRNPNALVWFTTLKDKDEYTALHSLNVSVFAIVFGRFLGLDEAHLEELGLGGLMHDIGKLRIPFDILHKPAKLSPEEFEVVKEHTTKGYKLLDQANLPRSALEIAYAHHEANNGSGYPRGLQNDQIGFYCKLVSVVDKYDAMTSDRHYHQGISPQRVIKTLYDMRGDVLDETLVNEFIRCLGVYPIGSLVEMTTGEVGIVLGVNQQHRLRPKVLLVRNWDKKPYMPSRIVDLEYIRKDGDGADYGIRSVLDPGSYGINTNDYIQEYANARAMA